MPMASANIRSVHPIQESALRKHPCWISAFIESQGNTTPQLFRKWSAIACLAGALERRVWVRFGGFTALFPNLYVLLVGKAGIGKGVAMDRVEDIWRGVKDFHVAPSSVSRASLMDALDLAKRHIIRLSDIPPYDDFNSLLVLIRELGVFLPVYETGFMAMLTDIYDGKPYQEMKRTGNLKIRIDKPQFNLLMSCTPSYLSTNFPEAAWEQGFASRTVMVYSEEHILNEKLFDNSANPAADALSESLLDDVNDSIKHLYGEFYWEPNAEKAFMHWYLGGQEYEGIPRPSHPKLVSYLSRRWTQVAKLCMVSSVSRGNTLRITHEDFVQAIQWLIEAEFYMEDIFKMMVVGGDASVIEEASRFVFKRFMANQGQQVPDSALFAFITARGVPAYNVPKIVDMMIRMDRVEESMPNRLGRKTYKPVIHQEVT